MSLHLTSHEVDQLSAAIGLLVSPLDHDSVDEWRSLVNRRVGRLLGADSAGFLLPVADGPLMYSDEHDPDELARYPDYPPPPLIDGTPVWEAIVSKGVTTIADAYAGEYQQYLGSAYYNEYSGANGAHDTLTAAVSLGGSDAGAMAVLHLWHERPDGRTFTDREVAILKILYPAFRAGVESQMRWGAHRQDLLDTLDRHRVPSLVADMTGRTIHRTPSMERLLAADPESGCLTEMMGMVVREFTGRALTGVKQGASREIRTRAARYRICACLYGRRSRRRDALVLVGLERITPIARSESELRTEFGLTLAESRLAVLLARGKSNAEIARELVISPHTARRHTEKVFRKLGVAARAQVWAKVFR